MKSSDETIFQLFEACLHAAEGVTRSLHLTRTSVDLRKNDIACTKEITFAESESSVILKISLSLIQGKDLAVLHGFLVRADKKNISIADYMRVSGSREYEQSLRLLTKQATFATDLCVQVSEIFRIVGTKLLPVLRGEEWVNVPVDFQGLK